MLQPRPFGKYVLLDKLAAGGMAEVYRAIYRTEGDFEKPLVIKRILPQISREQDFVSRFRDEAKLSLGLGHANIVQVFDFGTVEGDYFLAMELVEGQNLRMILHRAQQRGVAIPHAAGVLICAEAAKALAYAHSRKDEKGEPLGIVHRDMSPSNILVSYEGEVKITDFGIAKATSRSTETQDGTVRGKVRYMAPEQALAADDVDGRADVFSLGAVLWECLTGELLLDAPTDMAVLGMLVRGVALRKPSEVLPVDAELERVVMAAVAVDAKDRLTAAAFHRELARISSQSGWSSIELAAFLRSLFQEEIDKRVPLQTWLASKEGAATLAKIVAPSPVEIAPTTVFADSAQTKTPVPVRVMTHDPRRRRWPFVIAGVAVATVAAFAASPFLFPAAPAPTPTPFAIATPSPTPVPSATSVAMAPSPTPTPTRKVAPRTPTPVPVPSATRPPVVAGTGVLVISSDPDGHIYIDGKDSGRDTPALNLKLPAGRHEVRIENKVAGRAKTFFVEIRANEETRVPRVTLDPI